MVPLGDGHYTDRGIEFPGNEVRFRHQDVPHSPAGSSFRKEFVLLDTDPHRAREKVMRFRLRSFWPIKILILQWFIVPLIIWTIDLDVWIVQTGISIWFQIFVPFNETALWSPEWAGISINMAGQSQFRQKDFTLLRCFMPLKDRSLIDSSCTGVTLNP